jgi:hypothetical protein
MRNRARERVEKVLIDFETMKIANQHFLRAEASSISSERESTRKRYGKELDVIKFNEIK